MSTDRGDVAFKFAAGSAADRRQDSSTWLVRVTRGGEVFVTNRDAGGRLDIAHLSFHKDGRCHAKFRHDPRSTGRRGMKKVHEWALPDPIANSGIRRLADILIPHAGLVVPDNLLRADLDTILIPPPGEARQLAVTLFMEPGGHNPERWPGRNSMGARFVARVVLHAEDAPLSSFTAVATYSKEGEAARKWSQTSVSQSGQDITDGLRGVLFAFEEVDGASVPVLTEMPIGHMRGSSPLGWCTRLIPRLGVSVRL